MAFIDAVVVIAAGILGYALYAVFAHQWAVQRHAGDRHQPGGVEALRLEWLTAVEVRGIRPYLDQQRALAPHRDSAVPEQRDPRRAPQQQRRPDRSAAARTRAVLAKSFGRLPEPGHPFIGRRRHLTQITQWVNRDRARTDTRPTVVVLHGPSGSGRTMLARWAAHELRELFRGACLVDLRGQSVDPLPTRDAILHLMNRLGAPRDQLLFREGAGREADAGQLRRLAERYHQHLAGLPVVIILDDATDAEQVATLIPERSDSLVLVTAAEPLDLAPSCPPPSTSCPSKRSTPPVPRNCCAPPSPTTPPSPPAPRPSTTGTGWPTCATAAPCSSSSPAPPSPGAPPRNSSRRWKPPPPRARAPTPPNASCAAATPT